VGIKFRISCWGKPIKRGEVGRAGASAEIFTLPHAPTHPPVRRRRRGSRRKEWPENYHAFRQPRLAQAAKLVGAQQSKPARGEPSLPLDRYVGDHGDPWYGTIKVRRTGDVLAVQFPRSTGMDSVLVHHQYDTFRTRPALRWIESAFVTFTIDADGKVDRVRMKAVSPLADFSFDYHDLDFAPVTAAAKGGK
jgi:hypothetical protein